MIPMQQQLSAAARVQAEAQLAWTQDWMRTAIESAERLMRLNIAAVRASVQESSSTASEMLEARSAHEAMSLMRAQTGPTIGKAIAYGNHLVGIASEAHAEMTRCAETRIAEAGRRTGEFIEEASRTVPGSEPFLAWMKAAIGNASSGYESLNRSSRQAVEVLESNVNAAVNQIVHPASEPESPDQPTTPTVGS